MNTCRKCGKIKKISEFHKRRDSKLGVGNICRKCYREWYKIYSKTPKGIAKNRKNVKNWSKNHPQKISEIRKQYRDNHREQFRFYWRKRRNLKYSASGHHTFGEWEVLKKQYGFTCPCCLKTEPSIILTRDHIIPLSKGGSDYIENIQPLCKMCNSRKNTKTIKYLV